MNRRAFIASATAFATIPALPRATDPTVDEWLRVNPPAPTTAPNGAACVECAVRVAVAEPLERLDVLLRHLVQLVSADAAHMDGRHFSGTFMVSFMRPSGLA